MSNTYFQFKRFIVHQELCAMKVGTDGTLLGAWAKGGSRILDIGTGTGLIALMMAQRFENARLTGIDVDADACRQAQANVEASPFHDRIEIVQVSLQKMFTETFSSIVSNPPFYTNALTSPDDKRTLARHANGLSYRELMIGAARLLSEDGEFSVVIPSECRSSLEAEAVFSSFFLHRLCAVKTTPRKSPRRFLLAFGKKPVSEVEQKELVIGSDDYNELLKNFYLKL